MDNAEGENCKSKYIPQLWNAINTKKKLCETRGRRKLYKVPCHSCHICETLRNKEVWGRF